jgi:hypothetical protein
MEEIENGNQTKVILNYEMRTVPASTSSNMAAFAAKPSFAAPASLTFSQDYAPTPPAAAAENLRLEQADA